jgi:hypothetical protein
VRSLLLPSTSLMKRPAMNEAASKSSRSSGVVATAEVNRPWLSYIMPLRSQRRKHVICSTPSPVIVRREGVNRLPVSLNTRSGSSLIGSVE